LLQVLASFGLITAPIFDFYDNYTGSLPELKKDTSFFYVMLVATELVLHYVRQLGTLASLYTISVEDVDRMLLVVQGPASLKSSPCSHLCRSVRAGPVPVFDPLCYLLDYNKLLTLFDWRLGSNQAEWTVMANYLHKV
jgi:hypothetical protein